MLQAGETQQAKQYFEMADALLMQQQVLDHLIGSLNTFAELGTGYTDEGIVSFFKEIKGLSFSRNEVFNILQQFNGATNDNIKGYFETVKTFKPRRPKPAEKPLVGRTKGGVIIP